MKTQSNTSRAAKQPNPSAPQGAKLVAPQDIAGTKPKPGSRAGLTGHSNGNGKSKASAATAAATAGVATRSAVAPRARSARASGLATPQAAEADQPRYDQGLRFNSGIRYAVTDPVVASPIGKAKVKLELSSRTDPALAAFGESIRTAMTGNPLYPDPTPSDEVFYAKLAEFEALLSDLENLRVASKNLTEQKDRVRKEFEVLFSQRGNYVQIASNGNPDAIASAGMSTRNSPTPVGVLPPPVGLRLALTTVHGQFDVRWNTVSGAKSYVVEYAEVVGNAEPLWVQLAVTSKLSQLVSDLTPTRVYAFRVASIGGSNGVSQWSLVVQKMAY